MRMPFAQANAERSKTLPQSKISNAIAALLEASAQEEVED